MDSMYIFIAVIMGLLAVMLVIIILDWNEQTYFHGLNCGDLYEYIKQESKGNARHHMHATSHYITDCELR